MSEVAIGRVFVSEAANGFRSTHDADELMRERRVYSNDAASLTFLLFKKGVISAQDVLDVLHLNDAYRVETETELAE